MAEGTKRGIEVFAKVRRLGHLHPAGADLQGDMGGALESKPIIVGGGCGNSRSVRVIFQEINLF